MRTLSQGLRGSITVIFTLLLVTAEFGLLYGVYHRADGAREQRVVEAAYAGRLESVLGMAGTVDEAWMAKEALDLTRTYVVLLGRAGADDDTLAGVEAARTALSSDPSNAEHLRALGTAVDDLGTELQQRQATQDHEASLIYIGLLVAVSIGWAVWFRGLVRRHRALQASLTEQQARVESEARLSALVQNGADLVAIIDADTTTAFVSPSSQRVLGVSPEELLGKRVTDLVDGDDVAVLVQMLASMRPREEEDLQLHMQHADGRTLVLEGMLTNLLAEPAVSGFVLTVRDVTERAALEDRLTYQAFHDSLTGLANRQLFADRLTHALERGRGATDLVVLFCDLDDFKDVNDSLGHGVGDKVLAAVGERIHTAVRSGDTAARLGGDEFAVLMEATDLDTARTVAERIQAQLAEPIEVEDQTLRVEASIGMALAQPGELSSEETLRNADVAMYWAKDRGKGTIAVYETRLHEEALDRLELRGDLQRALREDELLLHYQPTVSLETGQIIGFEALVRWQHPTRGFMPPLFFVPIAEEMGLIGALGKWVLFEACRTAAVLQQDHRRPSMAVNISAQHLQQEDFVEEVLKALSDSGLPPNRLVLEITESVVLEDLDAVMPRLTSLRELGIRIAIDDFGTGYSSLAYLTSLPVDVLKVDKSFVDRVAVDAQGAAVTEAIIAMSRSMKLTTVAEGVEVAEQAEWLRGVHCQVGQGYFWSRPVPYDALPELMSRPSLGSLPTVPAPRAAEPDVVSDRR